MEDNIRICTDYRIQ